LNSSTADAPKLRDGSVELKLDGVAQCRQKAVALLELCRHGTELAA